MLNGRDFQTITTVRNNFLAEKTTSNNSNKFNFK